MTLKEQIVIKILLIVARHFCTDERLEKEIKDLQNHIYVYGSKAAA